jgi:hypothetical protein
MEAELRYYRRRSVEEMVAATAAHDAKVRRIHLELASRYDEKVMMIEAALDRSQPRLVVPD